MSSLKDLLELALADGYGPEHGQRVDPAADVSRGRRLLYRRRLAGAAGVAAAAAVGVLFPLAIHGAQTTVTPAGSGRPAITTPTASGPQIIALVAYAGQQPPGYRVAELPTGWVVQGGDAFALVIAPKDDANTEPDSYAGKLVVMLQSVDAQVPTGGTSLPVDGRPGRLEVQGDTQILTFQRADGRWVVIQAPTSLGWDGPTLAQFAAGVQVLANAQPGRG